jgi:hypothetical protein
VCCAVYIRHAMCSTSWCLLMVVVVPHMCTTCLSSRLPPVHVGCFQDRCDLEASSFLVCKPGQL